MQNGIFIFIDLFLMAIITAKIPPSQMDPKIKYIIFSFFKNKNKAKYKK